MKGHLWVLAQKINLVIRYTPLDQRDTKHYMKKGDVLNEKNLRIVRPGLGLPPKYYDVLLGKKVNCDLKKGTAVEWDLFS